MAEPDRCEECGLDRSTIRPGDAVAAVRSFPRRYRAAVADLDDRSPDPDDAVRRRPASGGWSALEITAHVADVLDLYAQRIGQALSTEHPTFASVDPDALVREGRAHERSTAEVLDALAAAAERLADTLDDVPADGWGRTGVRDGETVDVLWMARQAVHEGSHHLKGAQRALAEALR